MADKREMILQRLIAIMEAMPNYKSIVRNRGLRENEKRPALALMDGDEAQALVRLARKGTSRGGIFAPELMTMSPEIYILMDEQRPRNDEIGERVNAFRIALLSAIAGDAALGGLLGSNGGLVYNGCTTDLKSGSAMSGEMRMDFALTYTLNP